MIIEVKELTKSFNKNIVINGVNLSVNEGEIFGLLGPNGAGKTTTISILLGLNKFDSGKIKLFGKDITKEGDSVKKDIGFVPQDIAVFNDLTAYDNVAFFGKIYGLRGKKLKESIEYALNFTGLWGHRKKYPGKFSGGMKRRLNIACAIVHKPKIVFMDEPTVGVDPQSRNNILESIKKLNKMGSTIIYTSHYMEEVEEICNRIAITDAGTVIAEGTSKELKDMASLEDLVVIETEDIDDSLQKIIKDINGVTECIIDKKEIIVKSKKNSNNLTCIMDELIKNEANIVSVNVKKPTLEDAFLTLTGKKLRD
ncbi:ABC transporter ATP-binding protein [Bacillus thuringiensis]|uniref:ABC transporter ATP-binding protein n=1 Tax=Bacillus thuringiensis TaxID=1428 RepID=UPI000BF53C29|nr:ABC transporter ATP-binding protein [Bacillus thuringiensis]PFJ51507.1 export ABC transporter ATP-binding protein [Bacillus thuringiensis]PFR39093.1 export ABC transporter ATP-binding protein [Bacillus thuringiensis]PGL28056.1 export ABC transporter ATP-binding protein [Bacillus thuringiensis]